MSEDAKPAKYIELYVTFKRDRNGTWGVQQYDLSLMPPLGVKVYLVSIEVPRELLDVPEAAATVKPVADITFTRMRAEDDLLQDVNCSHCSHPIRHGLDLMVKSGDTQRHKFRCPTGKTWPEDNKAGAGVNDAATR